MIEQIHRRQETLKQGCKTSHLPTVVHSTLENCTSLTFNLWHFICNFCSREEWQTGPDKVTGRAPCQGCRKTHQLTVSCDVVFSAGDLVFLAPGVDDGIPTLDGIKYFSGRLQMWGEWLLAVWFVLRWALGIVSGCTGAERLFDLENSTCEWIFTETVVGLLGSVTELPFVISAFCL